MIRVLALALALALPAAASDEVCSKCHAGIYRRYKATPMARSSGAAADTHNPNQSFSGNGGYRYAIARRGGELFLDFGKAGAAPETRPLSWFAGSGATAQSYLIPVEGFLYEAPATYYSRTRSWAPSPGYERYGYPFLTRAIAPGCLQCHATGVRAMAGTQNGFESPPFVEAGIGCERCHGPGDTHAASGQAKDIVNPSRLAPEARDSICNQCHLSGEIRVERAGKSMADFQPGERLSEYAIAFLREGASSGMRVTGHAESLAQSACSRASGGRLWCGSCHDPHSVPAPAQKAAWFRAKCQECHTASECSRGNDCVACHMPSTPVTDAEHVVYTDHSISRRPAPRNRKPAADAALIAFGNVPNSERDLGLAYAIVALRETNADYSQRAFDLLLAAERRDPDDPQTLAYLADIYKSRRDDENAARLYERLYRIDRTQSSAPANLGAYRMEQHRYAEAIPLFEEALRISPALVLVRLNLAVCLIQTGRRAEARAVLEKALRFNPSFQAARDLLVKIRGQNGK